MSPGSRPIRVLRLRSVDGPGGGPERTIYSSTAAQDGAQIRTTLVYLRPPGPFWLAERAREAGLDYREIPDQHAFDPRAWLRLTTLVRSEPFDLIHSHDYKTDALMLWLSRIGLSRIGPWRTARRPPATLSSVHSFDAHLARGWHRQRIYAALRRRLLPTFDRVIAVSRGLERRLVELGIPAEKIEVLVNGVDTERFQPRPELRSEIRAELGLEDRHEVVGTFGRLARVKRVDRLLRAVARLQQKRPELHCVLAGDGPLRQRLEQQARDLGIAQRCRFLGHRPRIERLHAALDVFVSTSSWEGLPNAVLEAMASGVPLIATRVDGNDEVFEPGVSGEAIGDSLDSEGGELVLALDRLLEDRERASRLANAARTRVLRRFSAAAMHRRLAQVYREIFDREVFDRELVDGSQRG
ncbi:MAG: glycosyltransferase [Acidobacteriota bacterium]